MAEILTGRVKSLIITPHGGSAITVTGVQKVSMKVNHNVAKDWDPQADAPDHWRGNKDRSITLTTRDRQVALALISTPCIDSLTCVLAKPRRACDAAAMADGITIAGETLACVSEAPVDASENDTPGYYDVTFEVSRDSSGVAGSLTATPAA